MISVLIMTKNEQQDLPGCLGSVSWSDDVHVFDSYSTDGTAEIAVDFGAAVTQRVFDNYAAQRNAALQTLRFKYEWVLLLDADEIVPAPLVLEIRERLKCLATSVAAVRLRRRDFFMGTWLKHAQLSPFFIRIVRPGRVHYEREVNEVLKVDGEIVDFNAPYDHFPFSKGVSHWIYKHNVYSSLEAGIINRRNSRFSLVRAMLARDFNERRGHQKALFLRMPFRPFIKFCYLIFFRRAFLDGRAGITYAILQSIYEYFITLKVREMDRAVQEQAGDARKIEGEPRYNLATTPSRTENPAQIRGKKAVN
jgi:glycosyltransferase involved in cell wall biosynthesis